MRAKWVVVGLVVALLPSFVQAATTGKIAGRVVDKDSKEPLPGVNVMIEGTLMGAATDEKGFYVILNVPVGTYSVRAQYIGYQTVTISNIRVHVDRTTEVNFELQQTVIEGQEVTIVAERPLVPKNVTNTVKVVSSEELENVPMRGITTVMNLSSAVVEGSHVRGGRSDENVAYIDGVMTTRLRDGATNALSVIHNAIEEAEFHEGGFEAEYGFANAGVLIATTKTGGRRLSGSLEAYSDEVFDGKDDKFLGIQTWGINQYVGTIGGPVPFTNNRARFFLAFQRDYNRGYATFHTERFKIDTVLTYGVPGTPAYREFHFKIDLPPGRFPGYSYRAHTTNGNVVYELRNMRFKLGGSYHRERTQGAGTWNDLWNYKKNGVTKRWDGSAYLNITHQLSPRMFYTLNFNYFYYKVEYGDPDLWDQIEKYADPQYNMGPDGKSALRDWGRTYSLSLFGLLNPIPPGQVTSTYGKSAQENFGPKFQLIWQFNDWNELKTGFEYNWYTIRRYFMYSTMAVSLGLHERAMDPTDTRTDFDIFRNQIINYGYDIWGNEIDKDQIYEVTHPTGTKVKTGGFDGPKHPVRGAFYLQDKIELRDLILNAGVRVDYLTTGTQSYKDSRRLLINALGLVDSISYGEQRKYAIVSPRLGWSFPVTDRTVFHAQFGKFVQLPQLDDLYDGYTAVGRFLQGGNARTMPNPNLKPERTIQYEVGFKQQIGDNASLGITAFYKDIKDYIQIRVQFPEPGRGYGAFYELQNVDFGTTKGVNLTFNLRRTRRIAARLDYTYSKAMGTGSNSRDHFDIAWQDQQMRFPTIITPLAHNQDHVGNANIDIRFTKTDGPSIFGFRPLADLGINLFFVTHSGSRYTKIEQGPLGLFPQNAPRPIEALNSSTLPWYHRLDMKIDRTFEVAGLRVKPYIWVYNVLNRKNVVGVFQQTGMPQDNGWFLTEDGKAWLKANGKTGEYIARKYLSGLGTRNLDVPRVVYFGIKLDF
jgi:outer membrane receptor protein involved in Fe transport